MRKKLELTAKEAQVKTLKEQENRTWEAIRDSIHNGLYNAPLNFNLDQELKSKLVKLGYKFKTSFNSSVYNSVSWDKENL